MTFPLGETVTRLRATKIADPYSQEQTKLDWSAAPDELLIPNCGIADGGSTEPLEQARNAVDADFDVVIPGPAVDVGSRDRMVVRGLTCEIVGRPFPWVSPWSGWEAGTVIRCKVRAG